MDNSVRDFFAAATQTVTLGTTQQFGKQMYSTRVSLPMRAKESDDM
jgi:hypothetical protein